MVMDSQNENAQLKLQIKEIELENKDKSMNVESNTAGQSPKRGGA